MCRQINRALPWLCALLLPLAAWRGFAATDDVAAWLEQRGLKQLLASHLEQQLETAPAEQRGDLTLRLASLYAELLEITTDPAQRVSLEERSRKLLASAPASGSPQLRLALLRNTYRAAETVAETHRLRLSVPTDVESAKKSLAELIAELSSLRQQTKELVEVTDRRLGRATGAEALALQEALERARQTHAQCTFLTAWAMYYQAWLIKQREVALNAEPLFAELLGTESPHPEPQDVPMDSRSVEGVARAILGMALCKSITASSATAQAWVDLLQPATAFEPLRAQLPAWRIAIYVEHGQFDPAREVLHEQRQAGKEIPVAWLRLAAAAALDDKSGKGNDLARYAVLELASRGELDQIIDLANRFGVQAMGGSGFVLQYVRGMIAYQHARAAHGSDQPTLDANLVKQYHAASAALSAALGEKDADAFPAPVATCRRLIAWCSFFQGQYLAAKDLFLRAKDNLDPREAPDALWMAIVCLDRLLQADGNERLRAEQAALIEEFLNKYPSDPHAAKLVLKRALAADEVSQKAVNDLLSVPPGSDVYASAQRRAADILYQLFRDATGPPRIAYGQQFLNVAVPQIADAGQFRETTESAEVQRAVARCRRILEIALTDGIDDLGAARPALQAIDHLAKLPNADLRDCVEELDYRRLQARLLAGEVDAAAELAEKLWSQDPATLWSRLAARSMFKYGQRIWKDPDASAEQRRHGIELVVRHGGRVLREYADDPATLDHASVLAYHAAVAEASMKLWEDSGDTDRGKAALFLFERLLAKRPRNATFLRSTAILSERFGNQDKAAECWRNLASGTPQGTEPWYEAKFRLISLLKSIDPARARQIMDQHKQLYPEFGPEPWAARLRGLDAAIPAAASPATLPGVNSTQPTESNNNGSSP